MALRVKIYDETTGKEVDDRELMEHDYEHLRNCLNWD